MKINFYEARMAKDDKVKLVKENAVDYELINIGRE